MNTLSCDIIIPVYDRLELTKNCLESILLNTGSPYTIILIDNGSGSDTRSYLDSFMASHDRVTLIRNSSNLGWVKAVNQGMAISKSPYVSIMNNDTVVRTAGWLEKLIKILQDGRAIGMISPIFDTKVRSVYEGEFVETDYCRGHCVVIKREVIERIGPLDEAFGLGYYDDVDYSLSAAKAGYHSVMANHVIVEHVRNSTFSSVLNDGKIAELQEKNRKYLESKWGRRLRLVFITGGDIDIPKAVGLFFASARRGHYVYIWNKGKVLGLAHTNMVEKKLPGIFSRPVSLMMLAINKMKDPKKRYDRVFYLNNGFDAEDIMGRIESLSKA